jgi:excinuclease ABC subunit C
LPDLVVVDGGKGQLGVALAAARDVGIDTRVGIGLPIVALAKERESVAVDVDVGGVDSVGTIGDVGDVGDVGNVGLLSPPPEMPVDAPVPEARPAEPNAPATKPTQAKSSTAAERSRPDRVFLAHGKDPIPIGPTSAEMYVLARLRDEAHRFAVGFHRSQRKRRTLRSALSSIPGVGPARQRALLRHFGSLKKVGQASLDELLAVRGMNQPAASAVIDYFAAHLESSNGEPSIHGVEVPVAVEETQAK